MGWQVRCNVLDPLPDVAIFLRRYRAEDVSLARRLKSLGVKIVVDVVVNYFDCRDGTIEGVGRASREQVDNFRRLVDLADQVWAVSPFLQQIASQFHPKVYFVSDSVDPAHFDHRLHTKKTIRPPFVLGWAGVASKAAALADLAPILKPLVNARRVRVLVVSEKRPVLGFPFQFRRWWYSRFPRDIAVCDLCIAPRTVKNDYERGHSIFKIGVFMTMGVPALAGPVPAYDLLLGDGSAGAICKSTEEWAYHLSRFLSDSHLQNTWSKNARRKMLPFTTPRIAQKVSKLLSYLVTGA